MDDGRIGNSADKLTENDVVEAVCRYLVSNGYTIEQRLTTRQTGDDIVATLAGEMLYIEAKGATSAREGSARFGMGFDSAQVRVHVAEAVYKAFQVLSRSSSEVTTRAAIALPANLLHQREAASVSAMLRRLDISVFWVLDLSNVSVQ